MTTRTTGWWCWFCCCCTRSKLQHKPVAMMTGSILYWHISTTHTTHSCIRFSSLPLFHLDSCVWCAAVRLTRLRLGSSLSNISHCVLTHIPVVSSKKNWLSSSHLHLMRPCPVHNLTIKLAIKCVWMVLLIMSN